MPKPQAAVDSEKCNPALCNSGVCAAVSECPNGIISQEAPYELPYIDLSLCRGCFKCKLACPLKAISRV